MAFVIGITELKELANVLTERTGQPFTEMPFSFLKRRLAIIFEKFRIKNQFQFIELLEDPAFIDAFMYNIPVDCTEMFRDPGFWRTLNTKVLSKLKSGESTIWFPDGASGEEVFSCLIMMDLNGKSAVTTFNHPSQQKITEISRGILTSKDLELVESNFKRLETNASINDFISFSNNAAQLNHALLPNLKGEKGWFLNLPHDVGQQSLIMLRNTGLYFNKGMYEKILLAMYNHLLPGGYLAIGIKECLPECLMDKMEIIDLQENIYKKPGILLA
jgi:chemotaxis protein methyltransferase CheR